MCARSLGSGLTILGAKNVISHPVSFVRGLLARLWLSQLFPFSEPTPGWHQVPLALPTWAHPAHAQCCPQGLFPSLEHSLRLGPMCRTRHHLQSGILKFFLPLQTLLQLHLGWKHPFFTGVATQEISDNSVSQE